jgi:hypothetical protein
VVTATDPCIDPETMKAISKLLAVRSYPTTSPVALNLLTRSQAGPANGPVASAIERLVVAFKVRLQLAACWSSHRIVVRRSPAASRAPFCAEIHRLVDGSTSFSPILR